MAELSSTLTARLTHHTVRADYQVVYRGVRAPKSAMVDDAERARAAALLFPEGVLGGWTAASLHGVAFTAGHPVEIWLPAKRRRQGLIVRRGRLDADEVAVVDGLPVTTPVRTALDLARYCDGDQAIAVVDQMLRASPDRRAVTTTDEMMTHLDASSNFFRGRRVREVLAEADGRAESPWETYTRLLLHRSGYTTLIPQVPALGGYARVDLGDAARRVGVEYDGAHHRTGGQHKADVERWNALRFDDGWDIVLATSRDVQRAPQRLLRRVDAALRRRGWMPEAS